MAIERIQSILTCSGTESGPATAVAYAAAAGIWSYLAVDAGLGFELTAIGAWLYLLVAVVFFVLAYRSGRGQAD